MIKVKLLEHTPNPERVVAMAARLCYSASGAEELAEKMSDEQVEKLVAKIVQMGHASTMEHESFTFGIEGVSRVLTHQLVRHAWLPTASSPSGMWQSMTLSISCPLPSGKSRRRGRSLRP